MFFFLYFYVLAGGGGGGDLGNGFWGQKSHRLGNSYGRNCIEASQEKLFDE